MTPLSAAAGLTGGLAWLGARAAPALAAGVALAFFVPAASAALRPALPALVPLVLGLALARIDLAPALRAALAPRRLVLLVGATLLLMPATALLYAGLAALVGLEPEDAAALVYLAAAPPIASAGALCFLLGFNARLALEITIAATLLTPLVGPATVAALLPGDGAAAPAGLARDLGLMVAAALALAAAIRRVAGPARIAAGAGVLDGIGVIVLVIFVIPLFDGVPPLIAANPLTALGVLALATVANLGVNLALRAALRPVAGPADAGAVGLVFGNRNVAMYLAALPFDPRFALFVALYQVPMLLTPLILRTFGLRHPPPS